jgi:gliding motility-associated-like protein
VTFTNNTTGAVSYTWYFGDGSTSTATSPTHTYAANGFYTDSLVAVSAQGCSTVVKKIDDVKIRNLILNITPSPTEGCVPLPVNFTSTLTTTTPGLAPYPYPYGPSTYYWQFGDGATSTSTLANPSHTYTTTGVFTVKLTVVTSNGCTVTDSTVVRVGTLPVASFTYTPPSLCARRNVTFTNTSIGGQYYEWTFGDGSGSTQASPVHQYLIPGTYTVILTAFNNGCKDTFMVVNAVTVNPPNAAFEAVYFCDSPTKVKFRNKSQGATSQLWTFGDNTSSTLDSPVHVFPALATYSTRLVTYNATYGCSDTMTLPVELFKGTAQIAADDTAVCWGDSVTLTGNFPGALANSYSWGILNSTGGLVKNDTGKVIGYRFSNPGKYTVRLAVMDYHGCADTLTKTGYILVARPIVKFKVTDTLGCVPLAVTFTDTSSNTTGATTVSRIWRFGNGTSASSTATTAAFTYTTAGNYDVRLIVTDNVGCTDSLTKVGYVKARKPVAAFEADDTAACVGQYITFANNSSGAQPLSYNWDFGNSTGSTAATPLYAYPAVGSYNVRLIVTDASSCKDTILKTPAITLTRPTASFTASDTQAICPPLLVQYTNTSSSSTVAQQWFFNNGTQSVLPTPTSVYTTTGQWPAVLVAYDAQGCTDTARKTIRILGYSGALTYSPLSGCKPLTVQFTSSIWNVPSLIWDFSDGVTATATSTTTSHTYTVPGIYVPKLLFSDGQGCIASSVGLDTIKVDGVTAGFKWGPACVGQPVQFTDTSKSRFSAVSGWLWTLPGGATTTTQNPQQQFPGLGTFNVTLVATNAKGCSDTITKQVTINPLPVIDAGGDTVVCINDAVGLQASGGVSYTWTPTTTLDNPNIATPKASPTVPTVYRVVGTDANGCSNTDTVRVRVKTKTTSFVGRDTSVCSGSAVRLLAYGADVYQWVPSAGLDNATSGTPFASPGQTVTYLVIAREGTCLPDTNKVKVTVNPKPDVSAGPDIRIVAGGSGVISATGTATDAFSWSPSEGLSCTDCSAPTAAPKRTTTYEVVGTNNFGCSDSDDVTVFVQCNGSQVFVPNTFTPNGNGANDRFYPHGIGLDKVNSFRIYNRWGEIVYQKSNFAINDASAGWDGTYGGEKLPPDVFVYVLEAVCDNGEPLIWKGDVTLIR